jgi:hypothetical protein
VNAEAGFSAEIREGIERLKREINYNPTYFNRMVGEHGPIEATRRLVMADTASEGFTKLWEHGRLAMSVEALVILPWYASLFGGDVIQRARQRLLDYRFDVDAYLRTRTATPPSWWQDQAAK